MRRSRKTVYPPLHGLSETESLCVVKDIFSSVTGGYDFLNRLLSLRRDVSWRRKAVREMRFFRTGRLLDVATGTCDFAVEAARRHSGIRVSGVDLVFEMLALGQAKIKRSGLRERVALLMGDAYELPFADERFDVAAVAFGIRNMPDRVRALREMIRVTVPGGRVMVLEMTLPGHSVLGPLYRLYLKFLLPRMARIFSPNPDAYHYLADSIIDFPKAEVFAGMMREAGLKSVEIHTFTFGITCLHVGIKPETSGE